METVKKVKFPLASVSFLIGGLLYGISTIVNIILLISYSDVSGNDFIKDFLSPAITYILFLFTAFTCIYLAIILLAKKRNMLLIIGVTLLPVFKLINFAKNIIVLGFDEFRINFDSFPLFIESLNYNYIFQVADILFHILFLVLVICLANEKNKSRKLLGKTWFILGSLYFIEQLISILIIPVINEIVRAKELNMEFGGVIGVFLGYTFSFVISLTWGVIPFLLLPKWLAKPYKFVKVKPQPEPQIDYTMPAQEEPVQPDFVSEGYPVYEAQPVVRHEPVAKPEPVARPEPVTRPATVAKPQQPQAVKRTENKTSVTQASNDLYTLKKMLDDGLITEEDYITKKKQLLDL